MAEIDSKVMGAFRRSARLLFFFFFQAEDGIRDVAVTGVQTCALPIFPFLHWNHYEKVRVKLYIEHYGDPKGVAGRVLKNLLDLLPITKNSVVLPLPSRSEERRVGKECRYRWSPYHYKKNSRKNETKCV